MKIPRINTLKKGTYFKVLGLLISLALGGCYKKGDVVKPNKVFASDSVVLSNVTYENYIHDLLKKNCSTCHGAGGGADVWWLNENTYENAVKFATPITHTMINGTMPPPPKFPFSETDKKLLKAWVDRGMPLTNSKPNPKPKPKS